MVVKLTDFWDHVDKNGPNPDYSDPLIRVSINDGNCWVWTGVQRGGGYGVWRGHAAHRYTIDAPDGMDVDHLCRNRLCVRPNHLEVVTRKENLLRGNTLQRSNAVRNTCKYDHPLDDSMVTNYTYRGRRCMICHRWNMAVYTRQKRDGKLNSQEKMVYAETLAALEKKQGE